MVLHTKHHDFILAAWALELSAQSSSTAHNFETIWHAAVQQPAPHPENDTSRAVNAWGKARLAAAFGSFMDMQQAVSALREAHHAAGAELDGY